MWSNIFSSLLKTNAKLLSRHLFDARDIIIATVTKLLYIKTFEVTIVVDMWRVNETIIFSINEAGHVWSRFRDDTAKDNHCQNIKYYYTKSTFARFILR